MKLRANRRGGRLICEWRIEIAASAFGGLAMTGRTGVGVASRISCFVVRVSWRIPPAQDWGLCILGWQVQGSEVSVGDGFQISNSRFKIERCELFVILAGGGVVGLCGGDLGGE